jgi:hypothetical protein
MKIDDHSFGTTLTVHELLNLVLPGRAFLPKTKNDPVTERMVQSLAPFHLQIQRDLTGRKLGNAKGDLKNYILNEWVPTAGNGVLPPYLVFFPEKIEIKESADCRPLLQATIPAGRKGILLDGESRVEACLFTLDEANDEQVRALLAKRVSVVVFHNVEVAKASKWFADINGKGVGVNPNLLVARDFTDPWATTAQTVFEHIKVLLEKDKRQVSHRSPAVITALQARTMVAAVGLGLSAVTYGAKPIPTNNSKGEDIVDWRRLENSAKVWFRDVFEKFGAEAFKDREKVLRSVPVLVSLGAIGRGIYSNESETLAVSHAFLADQSIDWSRGKHWAGIAGKINVAGSFSVGSGKENAYATYRALTDKDDAGYARIRHQESSQAAESREQAEPVEVVQ